MAAVEGVRAACQNQPCQVPELRPRLQQLLKRTGFPHPARDLDAASRRTVEAVLDGFP